MRAADSSALAGGELRIDSVSIAGFTDVQGFTEYRIRTVLVDDGGRQTLCDAQHRLTAFEALHSGLVPQLVPKALPAAFRIATILRVPYLLQTAAFKQERKQELDAYLAKRYGAEFEEWAAKTKRVIPFVI